MSVFKSGACRRLVFLLSVVVALALVPAFAFAAGVVDSDAGDAYSMAVLSDGSMWGWGYNAYGALGDGTLETHLAPVRIGTASNWKDVDAGFRHTLAIKADKTLWSMGFNETGQLGLGHLDLNWDPVAAHKVPTQVGTSAVWLMASAGQDHSVALDDQLRIWAWGGNAYGQLGDGSTQVRGEPVLISSSPGGGLLWKDVWADDYVTLALASDGSLWQWGLGVKTPTMVSFSGPIHPVYSSYIHWKAVSLKADRVCAVMSNSDLWTWETSLTATPFYYPSQTAHSESFDVAETTDDVNKVNTTMQVRQDGTLWVTVSGPSSPAIVRMLDENGDPNFTRAIVGNATNWTAINGGFNHFLIQKADGSLWGWGKNTFGQLGDGSESDKKTPTTEPTRIILPTPVPALVARTESDARDKIIEMGFKVGSVTYVATYDVPITKVISQTPAVDTLHMPDTGINIVVSSGPPVPVPLVVGMNETDARTTLGNASLGVYSVVQEYSSIVPKGYISSQDPVAGTLVASGTKITLRVSKGPQPKAVPYAAGQTLDAMRTSLLAAGFIVGTVKEEYSTRFVAGKVTRTDPPSGTQLVPGDVVNIYVSRGKPKAWISNPIAPKTMRANRSKVVYGYLKPLHPSGSLVRIYRWKKTKSGWRQYTPYLAKTSKYNGYSKYSKSIRLTAGKWRLRAYAPTDSDHAATWSAGYDYVTVK